MIIVIAAYTQVMEYADQYKRVFKDFSVMKLRAIDEIELARVGKNPYERIIQSLRHVHKVIGGSRTSWLKFVKFDKISRSSWLKFVKFNKFSRLSFVNLRQNIVAKIHEI